MNLAANQQAAAISAAVGMSSTQAQMWAAVLANEAIPAAERQKYLNAITATNSSNIALIEQIYGIDLQWATGGAAPTVPGTTPANAAVTPQVTQPTTSPIQSLLGKLTGVTKTAPAY